MAARNFFSPPGAGHLAAGAAALQAHQQAQESAESQREVVGESVKDELATQAEEKRTMRRVNDSLQARERSARAAASQKEDALVGEWGLTSKKTRALLRKRMRRQRNFFFEYD